MLHTNFAIWRKAVTAAFVLAVLNAAPGSAHAVDVANADATMREVIVNDDNGDSKTLKLAPHQKITGVCESCVVAFGRDSVEASKRDVVKISGGKVSVSAK
jgi:hypothetical protein